MKRLAGMLAIATVAGTAEATLIFDEAFSYSDGDVTAVSSGAWVTHSGTTAANISSGELQLTYANSMDVNRVLDTTYSSGTLYYSFSLKMTALPSGTAGYFAHFLQTSSTFRDRLWATNGVSGYVLGISNNNSPDGLSLWATELALDTTYLVVVGSDLDTDTTTLWIDPVSSGSTSITKVEATTVTPTAMAFRQAAGIGTMTVDSLKVATEFADVIPEPATVGLIAGPGLAILLACLRRRREESAAANKA